MIAEQKSDGTWIAHGKGCVRRIVAEGKTRKEATRNWREAFQEQTIVGREPDVWFKSERENTVGGVAPRREDDYLLKEE